jgi:hypothetical protein
MSMLGLVVGYRTPVRWKASVCVSSILATFFGGFAERMVDGPGFRLDQGV